MSNIDDFFEDVPTGELGFLNKTNWLDDEQVAIILTRNSEAIAKTNVAVYEEVPQTGVINNDWDVTSGDTGFTLEDSALAVTLTPAATSGDSVDLTLGSGSWASTDVGKIITNISAGETGVARIISILAGVATCQITIAFTDTNAIASGDWKMNSGEFVGGAFVISNSLKAPTVGAVDEFQSGAVTDTALAMLTSTKAICCYDLGGAGKAVILDINASTLAITSGVAVNFNAGGGGATMSVTALTATKAIVAFSNTSDGSKGFATVLDVAGSTITPGTATQFSGGTNQGVATSITALTSVKAIVAYAQVDDQSHAVILDVSGTTITPGTSKLIHTSVTTFTAITKLTTSRALSVDLSGNGKARILDVSGTTITLGADFIYSSSASFPSLQTISATQVIVAYKFSNGHGLAQILDVLGSTVGGNTVEDFDPTPSVNHTEIGLLTTTRAIISYEDANLDGAFVLLDISGTSITAGTPDTYKVGIVIDQGIAVLSSTQIITSFDDTAGEAVVIEDSITAYVDNVHIPTISGTDSVDTTFFSVLNSMTVTETLNGEEANYAFSFNPTFISNVLNGGTFIVIGSGESTTRNIASSLNSVHGGTEGVWFINTNAVYASETWGAATVNSPSGALSQAMDTAKNLMDGTAVGAATGNWPSFGTVLASAFILKTTVSTVTPEVDKVSFNYDGNILNQLETDKYTIDQPAVSQVRVTAPSSGGPRNARVYVSR